MNPPRKTSGLFLTPRGPYGQRLPERARHHMRASEDDNKKPSFFRRHGYFEGSVERDPLGNVGGRTEFGLTFGGSSPQNNTLTSAELNKLQTQTGVGHDQSVKIYRFPQEGGNQSFTPDPGHVPHPSKPDKAAQQPQEKPVPPTYVPNSKLAGSDYTLRNRGVPATLSGTITPERAPELAPSIVQPDKNKAKRTPK